MSTRNLRFRVVRIEIDIGKNATIGVPASYLSLYITQHKLLSGRAALFDNQASMRFGSCAQGRKTEPCRDTARGKLRLCSRCRCMIPVAAALCRSLVHGVRTAVGSQGRAAFIAILRAIEVFSFAPIACNHDIQKASHFSANARATPTHLFGVRRPVGALAKAEPRHRTPKCFFAA